MSKTDINDRVSLRKEVQILDSSYGLGVHGEIGIIVKISDDKRIAFVKLPQSFGPGILCSWAVPVSKLRVI